MNGDLYSEGKDLFAMPTTQLGIGSTLPNNPTNDDHPVQRMFVDSQERDILASCFGTFEGYFDLQ